MFSMLDERCGLLDKVTGTLRFLIAEDECIASTAGRLPCTSTMEIGVDWSSDFRPCYRRHVCRNGHPMLPVIAIHSRSLFYCSQADSTRATISSTDLQDRQCVPASGWVAL